MALNGSVECSLAPLRLHSHDDGSLNEGNQSPDLTLDEARAKIRQLTHINRDLQATLQQTNTSMKLACDSFAAHKDIVLKERSEVEQRFVQARNVIETLKQTIADKNKSIAEREHQINEIVRSSNDEHAMGDLRERLSQSNGAAAVFKQQYEQTARELAAIRQQLAKSQTVVPPVQPSVVSGSEVKALQGQVTSLISDLQGARKQTSAMQQERDTANQRLSQLERDSEKHVDLVDNFRQHMSVIQDNLKAEKEARTVASNDLLLLKHKHEELMSDYHELLNEMDEIRAQQNTLTTRLRVEYEERLDNMTAQLVSAEETLTTRDEMIRDLKQRVQDTGILEQQLKIYKDDFEAERKSRENLNDRCLDLVERNKALAEHVNQLEKELEARSTAHQMQEMRRRHGHSQMAATPSEPITVREAIQTTGEHRPAAEHWAGPRVVTPTHPRPPPYEVSEFKCPLCGHVAPDQDSLFLHCNDCIQ